jgi:hypothetical protein
MALTRKKWLIIGPVAVVLAALVAMAAVGLHRQQAKQKAQAEYYAFIEKNFKEVQERSMAVAHEKEAVTMTKKQLAGRASALKKEIAKLRELVTFLER